MILKTSLVIIYTICLILCVLATELGFRLGRRHAERVGDGEASAINAQALQNSMLGLLALLIGFTFAMSSARYDLRKQLVIDEANAIGTTYLRTGFLKSPIKEEIQTLLAEYTRSRLDFHRSTGKDKELYSAVARANELNGKIWSLATDAARTAVNPVLAGLFISSLNDMIDSNEKRVAAMENHVPEVVQILLFIVTISSLAFIGYNCGFSRRRLVKATTVFAALILLVLMVILDLDRPRRGFIRVSQASMARLLGQMSPANHR